MRQPEVGTRRIGLPCAILAAALLVVLSAYVWLGTFTRYLTDDYCTAATLNEHGLIEAMRLHREAWSGRFAFYAIKGMLESIGPVTARAVPGLMTILLAVAAAWAFRRVLGEGAGRFALVAGLTVAYANLDTAPSRESRFGPFLWETGAITYMLAALLIAVWIGILVSRGSLAGRCVASFVLMLVAGGLSETSVASQGALTAGVIVLAVSIRERSIVWIAMSGLGGTLSALSIMASAPGNSLRMETIGPRSGILETAGRTLQMGNAYLGSHILVEGAPLVIVLVLGFVAGIIFPRVRASAAAGSAMIAFASYLASFAPSAWILPAGPPARALYVSNFFLIALLFASFAAIGSKVRSADQRHLERVAAAALLVLVVVPIRSTVAVAHWIPQERAAARKADAVDLFLATQRGRRIVLVSPWAVASRFATKDPGHWTNRCVSRFYELDSLSVVRH